MLPEQVFRHLARAEVTEIALQSGRLPCALSGTDYRPIGPTPLGIDDINEVLKAAGGRVHIATITVQPSKWDWEHPKLGGIKISAKYVGDMLQARLKLASAPKKAEAGGRKSVIPRASGDRKSRPPARNRSRPPPAPIAAEAAPQPEPLVPRPGRAPTVADIDALARAALGPPDPRPAKQTGDGMPVIEMPSLEDLLGEIPPAPRPLARLALRQVAFPASPADAELESFREEITAPRARVTRRSISPVMSAAVGVSRADKLDILLGLAREMRASDVHVIAERPPLFRVAADLRVQGDIISPEEAAEVILPRIPVRLREQMADEGSCDFALVHPAHGRFRANTTRQRTGFKLSLRPIPERPPTLIELGLPDTIARATNHHQGLIVVTGPTSHGKTTTMAALTDIINRERTHHIISLEDPIEFVHARKKAMISQREVGTHTRSFANALKASLREDPDVIVVGELRDAETVRMALTAAETGHLVLATMNTPSAAKTIERLIDLFPPAEQQQVRITLSAALRLIVSQRLVPNKDKRALIAAVEVLPGVPALAALIRDNRTFQIPSLQQRGKSMGIVRMDDSLVDLIKAGRTTLEIARDFSDSPEDMEALLTGRSLTGTGGVSAEKQAEAALVKNLQQGRDAGVGAVLQRAGKMFDRK